MDWIPAIKPAGSKSGATNALAVADVLTRNLEAVPARRRRTVKDVFDIIIQRMEVKAKKSAPSTKPIFINGRMQIKTVYCDNDSTVARLDDSSSEEGQQLVTFRKHLKKVHGADLILSSYGQHWQIAIIERFVALIKIGLRVFIYHSPL